MSGIVEAVDRHSSVWSAPRDWQSPFIGFDQIDLPVADLALALLFPMSPHDLLAFMSSHPGPSCPVKVKTTCMMGSE